MGTLSYVHSHVLQMFVIFLSVEMLSWLEVGSFSPMPCQWDQVKMARLEVAQICDQKSVKPRPI